MSPMETMVGTKLFNKGRSTINEHILNILKEGELDEKVVCRKFRQTTQHGAIQGKTQSKEVKFYNLDVITSVGYRVKSIQGTRFRQWATERPLLKGSGSISHEEAMDKALSEYRKYQVKILSPVEKAYLESINALGK